MYSGVIADTRASQATRWASPCCICGDHCRGIALLELYNEEFLLNSYEVVQFELPLSVLVLYTSICI
jgi:hypothetical protein